MISCDRPAANNVATLRILGEPNAQSPEPVVDTANQGPGSGEFGIKLALIYGKAGRNMLSPRSLVLVAQSLAQVPYVVQPDDFGRPFRIVNDQLADSAIAEAVLRSGVQRLFQEVVQRPGD